jgi:hypothetical protein
MRGFSTIELIVAFAILTLVMGGVLLADFSSTYWLVASRTSSEALFKATASLEALRANSKQDFYGAVSSDPTADADAQCQAGGMCYFLQSAIIDISACAKYAEASASWQVPGYATSTVSLPTMLADTAAARALGGDCLLLPPAGSWTGIAPGQSGIFSPGMPTSVDALAGTAYVSANQSPYLRIYKSGFLTYSNSFSASDPLNAVDAARDTETGKVYVFAAVASTTGQLMVIDVTDPQAPAELVRKPLAGVSPTGSSPQGWRLFYYDRTIYIVARNTAGPELHIFDVSNPAMPVEMGSGLNLGTSAYGIAVRDEIAGGVRKRFAYLATTLDSGEVMVVDVTNSQTPAVAATLDLDDAGCGLSDKPDGTSLFLSGKLLYVGRSHSTGSCTTLPDLYALDISDPTHPKAAASGVAGGGILGMRVSGGHLFAYVSTQANPTDTALFDIDGDMLIAAQHAGNTVQVWNADPARFARVASRAVASAQLQLFTGI